ncbi:unnamed protein product, partial [Ectocarpus sp. 13 AM-2016]
MGKLAVRGHVDCELSHVSLERVRGVRDTWHHTVQSCCCVVTAARCSLRTFISEDGLRMSPDNRRQHVLFIVRVSMCVLLRAWDMPRLADSQEPHTYRGTRSFHGGRMGITLDVIRPRPDEEWSSPQVLEHRLVSRPEGSTRDIIIRKFSALSTIVNSPTSSVPSFGTDWRRYISGQRLSGWLSPYFA